MRWSVIVALASVIVFAHTASAQQAPIVIDADVITYDAAEQVVAAQGNVRAALGRYRLLADAARFDLRTGIVVATGHVRLIDPGAEELRGQTLTYNTRAQEGFLERFEGILQRRVYIRGDRLDLTPARIVTQEATVTTCDPRRPLYRIVARRIEIEPDRRITAHHASLYLGNVRLITLPVLSISLRPEEGTPLPSFGYSGSEGYWVDYRLPVRIAGGRGDFYAKYGTLSGPFALLGLAYDFPRFTIGTRVGRTQTQDGNLRPYDVAEVTVTTPPARLGSLATWSFSGGAGWYGERNTGVSTSRLDAELSVTPATIVFAPNLTLSTRVTHRLTSYGTGDLRTITTLFAGLSYGLDRFTSLTVGYWYADVQGRTPFIIDAVDPARTFYWGGVRAVPDRYYVSAFVYHNAIVPETTMQVTLGVILSPSIEVGLFADYNFRISALTDIDYTLRWICDCIDIVLRYRATRREIYLDFGLFGLPPRPAPFVPRTEAPPLQFPDQP